MPWRIMLRFGWRMAACNASYKSLHGRMRLYSTAPQIFPCFEVVRLTYAEKQKIAMRLRNENGGKGQRTNKRVWFIAQNIG